jgi:hypothetical protein
MKKLTTASALTLPAAALALVAAGLVPSTQAVADPTPAAGPAAPAFLQAPTGRDLPVSGEGAVEGTRRLVTLDTSLLPQAAGRSSRTLGLALDSRTQVTARLDTVTQDPAFTAWQGPLVGSTGYFSLAEADGVYRGYVATTSGVFDISSAGGDQYWLTDRAPLPTPPEGETDAEVVGTPSAAGSSASSAPAAPGIDARAKKKGGKSKVTIVFGYTKDTLALVGGNKAALKASAALAVADTNLSFKNSGAKVKLKLKGVTQAKGKESNSQAADYQKLYNQRDGAYNNLSSKFRNRKGADLVHLFLSGRDSSFCGRGSLPYSQRTTNPAFAVAVSNLDCLSNLTPTHEIGHNLGADHNKFPGVTHGSRIKGNYGSVFAEYGFITVMSYFVACEAVGVYCINIPYYSSKKKLYNGAPTGSKKENNVKAINLVAPKVARYRR